MRRTYIELAVAKIRRYVTQTGMTHAELARMAGVPRQSLVRVDFGRMLEDGAPGVTVRTIKRLEDAMRKYPIPSSNGAKNGSTIG